MDRTVGVSLPLRERPAWREQLLQDGVHLAAGKSLMRALLELWEAANRLQELQAAREQGRPGCGTPNRALDVGGSHSPAKDAKGTETLWEAFIEDALTLIISATSLLLELQQVGQSERHGAEGFGAMHLLLSGWHA